MKNLGVVSFLPRFMWLGFVALFLLPLLLAHHTKAQSDVLTATPLTWNIIGLDSNRPASGPQFFPVGAEICNTGASQLTNVLVNFSWTTSNSYINLRSTTPSSITIPTLDGNSCADAYFEVAVTQDAAAYEATRGYVITATSGAEVASTPSSRELFVEYLISQNRNATYDVRVGAVGSACNTLQSVPAGGAMNLVVGESYRICLFGSTATQGYEQLESFLTLPNTIFQINNVATSYSANTSSNVSTTDHPRLYADACYWENDINSPNYRACNVSSLKSGGSVTTAYDVTILSGGGTSQTLNSLLYDFSGSSYHYNTDYNSSARFAAIIDPASADISKQFTPGTISSDGVSTLVITLTNPNGGTLSGYNFVDNLPAGMTVANPANASTNGCGTPTFSPTAGSAVLNFADGTIAANSSCIISVSVTASAIQTYTNTTSNLFVGTTDTGNNATADLIVTDAPPLPACTPNIELATWRFAPTSVAVPPAPTYQSPRVATATASFNGLDSLPGVQSINTTLGQPAYAWQGTGWQASNNGAVVTASTESYFQISLDTSNFNTQPITLKLDANPTPGWANPSNNELYVFASVNSGPFSLLSGVNPLYVTRDVWNTGLSVTTPSAGDNVVFRITAKGRSVGSENAALLLDNLVFTGCGIPQSPTLTKAFSPDVIGTDSAQDDISTLTFTLTNPNAIALTNASFDDTLPSGMTVANPPNQSTTCTGGSWTPVTGSSTLNFSGATIPAGSSCTVSVNVTSSTIGPSTNISGFISTDETGENSGQGGSATATLTVLAPPQIDKQFSPNPIVENGISRLSIVIDNPNQNDAINGVAFTDSLIAGLTIASVPNASNTCGGSLTAVANTGAISLTGGTIAAGSDCTIAVDVTAATADDYPNVSGNVSHIVDGQTFEGNTASDTLTVVTPNPSVTILKQVGTNNTDAGPWFSYISVAPGTPVYYRFIVENTGDTALTGISISDTTLATAGIDPSVDCSSFNLPVADALDDDHIGTCIIGPVNAAPGVHDNTATASGSGVSDDSNMATYATAAITIDKTASPTIFNAADENISYTFTVTNTGSATLDGPVTIDDDVTTNESCPALSTIGDGDNFFDPGEVIVCSASYLTTSDDVTNGSVTNIAFATADGFDSPTDSVRVSLPGADLSLTKAETSTVTPTSVGNSIQFTITLTNDGLDTATNVVVTDVIPAGIGSVTVTPNNTSVNNTATSWTAPNWSIPSIANGETVTLVINGTVTASGTITNSAEVTASDQADPDSTPNNDTSAEDDQDSASVSISTQADLSLTKSDTSAVAPTSIGDAVQFTITLTNSGPDTATNVVVTDVIPAGLGSVTATPNDTSVNNTATSWTAPNWSIPSIANGETVTLVINGTAATAGDIVNTTEITASDQSDPDSTPNNAVPTEDDQSTASVTISPPPQIGVAKQVTSVTPVGGGLIDVAMTFTVENLGSVDLTSVQVTDELSATFPAPTTFSIEVASSATGTLTANAAFDGSGDTNLLVAGSSTLPIGATETITMTVRVNPNGAPGPFSNTATASGQDSGGTPTSDTSDDGTDPDPDGDGNPNEPGENDPTPITLIPTPDLEISKTNDVGGATSIGSSFNWTLTVTNTGSGDATFTDGDVIVVDDLPPSGLTYGLVSVVNDTDITNLANINCAIVGTTLTCAASGADVTIGSVTGTLDVTLAVTATAQGSYTNPDGTCAVDPNEAISELDDTNNDCNNDTIAVDMPLIIATKADSLLIDNNSNSLVDEGDTVHYSVTIINSGTADATAVLFTDTPDANTTLVVGSLTSTLGTVTTGNTADDTTVSVDIGTLSLSGGTVTITYDVVVNTGLPASVTTIVNSGLVTGANFPDTQSNDPDTPADDDSTTTPINQPVTPTPSPPSQPTPAPQPEITYFDPAISKIGFLQAGETGLQGEQLTWVVTVTNRGNAPGNNIVVSDTLRDELRVEALNVSPPLTSSLDGQAVTVTIPSLAPGETVTFEIITTVIRGGTIDNTACLTADNLDGERCVTAEPVTSLPATGETPGWRHGLRNAFIVAAIAVTAWFSLQRIIGIGTFRL